MIILVLGAAIIVSGLVFYRKSALNYQLDPAAKDGSYEMIDAGYMRDLQQRADESSFRLQINSNPLIDATTMRGNLMVSNPLENGSSISVHIYLEETGEVVYQSKVLLPGERIAYDTLNTILKPGEYPAIAVISLIDEAGELGGELEAVLLLEVG